MSPTPNRRLALLALALINIQSPDALAAPVNPLRPATTLQEINVQLFGQPCLLSGPFPDDVLKAIHAVSPEKNPPPESAARARQLRERLATEKRLPEELERYRDRLSAHFEARLVFFEGFQAAQKSGQAESFISSVKAQVPQARMPAFKKRVEAIGKKPADWRDEERDALLMDFLDFAPNLPEEDFHRAIRAMNVNYVCTFDETEGSRAETR